MSGADLSELELLARLVAFDTTSHKTNMPLIDFVKDYLAQYGIERQLIPTEDGLKANLYATIGPQESEGGIGLSGHTDVVPVTGQDWDSDPFTLKEQNGLLYGRGTCDMKGFLACVLAAVPDFTGRKLRTPIHILFSYDEEIGCTGVRPMIDEFGKSLAKPLMVVVGEPTNMQVVDAHKGPTRFEVTISGKSAHSSMAHLGANAVMAAGRMIAHLDDMARAFKDGTGNERFTPPYTTLQVNMIEGGFAQNVIPASCTFGVDLRTLPGDSIGAFQQAMTDYAQTEILPDLRAVHEAADISIKLVNAVPGFEAAPKAPATNLALQLAGQNETFAVSYGTEAGLFQEKGSSTIVCGPGDIAQAHTANEFIARSEIDKCMAFLRRLADWAEG